MKIKQGLYYDIEFSTVSELSQWVETYYSCSPELVASIEECCRKHHSGQWPDAFTITKEQAENNGCLFTLCYDRHFISKEADSIWNEFNALFQCAMENSSKTYKSNI